MICAKVKDANGKVYSKYFTVNVKSPRNTSTVSAESINVGEKVTVNVSSADIDGSCTYSVLYKKASDDKWKTVLSYGENNQVSFKPAEAGAYDVCAKVKTADGKVYSKYFTVNVKSPKNTSTISAEAITLGKSLTVNVSAEDIDGACTYSVLYKKESGDKWKTVLSYGESLHL